MTGSWRRFTSQELEREYSPSSCLPDGDYRPFVAEYRRASDAAWAAVEADGAVQTSTVRYGDAGSQTVDLAVPAAAEAAPLLVFIHGGYWQELSKLDSRFAAVHAVRRGWAFAAVDYTLAPAADVATIVDECRAAVATLRDQAGALGFSADRIVVAGSSAGAHLAAMVGLDPALRTAIAGVVLVSGVYDLEPLVATSINDALGLTAETAAAASPVRGDVADFPKALLAYGDQETSQFKEQSRDFAALLTEGGHAPRTIEIGGRNHFDVILDLARPGTMLGDATGELMEATDADL